MKQGQTAVNVELGDIDKHLSAVNNQNKTASTQTQYSSHYCLVGTSLRVLATVHQYSDDREDRAKMTLANTEFASIEPIPVSTNKVHLDVQINCFDAQH